MLSPLHAMLDELFMEFTLVNYNLIDTPNLILQTLAVGKTFYENA